jgi:NB-ARC domain
LRAIDESGIAPLKVALMRGHSFLCRGDDLLLQSILAAVQRIIQPLVEVVTGQMFGLEAQLRQINTKLGMNSQELSEPVQLLGLYGLGGIGKTTLALQFYEAAKARFPDRAVFLHIGEDAAQGAPLAAKQRQLLSKIGGWADVASDGAFLRSSLRHSFKTGGALLLVLDDLWSQQQLEALLGCQPSGNLQSALSEFAGHSRVLVTSRREDIAAAAMAKGAKAQQVDPLPDAYARQVLSFHTYGKEAPPVGLTGIQLAKATAICKGLPLTLQLLGGALSQHETIAGWQVRLRLLLVLAATCSMHANCSRKRSHLTSG